MNNHPANGRLILQAAYTAANANWEAVGDMDTLQTAYTAENRSNFKSSGAFILQAACSAANATPRHSAWPPTLQATYAAAKHNHATMDTGNTAATASDSQYGRVTAMGAAGAVGLPPNSLQSSTGNGRAGAPFRVIQE